VDRESFGAGSERRSLRSRPASSAVALPTALAEAVARRGSSRPGPRAGDDRRLLLVTARTAARLVPGDGLAAGRPRTLSRPRTRTTRGRRLVSSARAGWPSAWRCPSGPRPRSRSAGR
jgi:hypothetical protein